ncbi:MAG: ferritin family protein [Candidatus Bipolaricaulaceae bacterium]
MQQGLNKALEFAVAKEKEAESYYRDWAAKAADPGVRRLFQELAGWEHGHVEKLSRIKPEELIAQGAAPPDLKLSDLLVEVKARPDMGLPEALAVAMKREQASVALYEGLSRLGGPASQIFSALVEEERRHKRLLEDEYEALAMPDN